MVGVDGVQTSLSCRCRPGAWSSELETGTAGWGPEVQLKWQTDWQPHRVFAFRCCRAAAACGQDDEGWVGALGRGVADTEAPRLVSFFALSTSHIDN